MKIEVLTLFPEMFKGALDESMLKIAQMKGCVEIELHDIREWTYDKHRTADDKPFGGGPGMVMKIEPVDKALLELKGKCEKKKQPMVVLLTPQGKKFDQRFAQKLSQLDHIILICGHYEGVDERVRDLVDTEISVGDYILTCGEIPAMVVCDAVVRLIPGVLGDESSLKEESFEDGLLEYPQYTRPAEYKGKKVPEVLLCGDPKKISSWKKEQALKRTARQRPDLMT